MTEGLTAETAATKQRLSAEARQLDRANAQGIDSGRPMNTSTSSTKPDHPNPQSQSLSRSYGSNLPTSLTYIILSTRGCSPWRPAADMGTSWCEFAVTPLRFSRSHRPLVDATKSVTLFAKKPKPILSSKEFQGLGGLCRKDNSSQSFDGRLSVCSCCHD